MSRKDKMRIARDIALGKNIPKVEYKCKSCGYTSNNTLDLVKHLMKKHKKETEGILQTIVDKHFMRVGKII